MTETPRASDEQRDPETTAKPPTMSANDNTTDSEQAEDEMTVDRGNVSVTGSANGGWTSYWDPEKHGQTVAGSSSEDIEAGEITTTNVPEPVSIPDPDELPEYMDGVDAESLLAGDELATWDDMSPEQKRVAIVTGLYPGKSKAAISRIADCSSTLVRKVGLIYSDVVRALAHEFHAGDPPDDEHWHEAYLPFDELSEKRQRAVDAMALWPEGSRRQHSELADVARPTIQVADGAHRDVAEKRREAFRRGDAEPVIEGVDPSEYLPAPEDAADAEDSPDAGDEEPAEAATPDGGECENSEAPAADEPPAPTVTQDDRVAAAIFAARTIERTHDDVAGAVAAELRQILEGEREVSR